MSKKIVFGSTEIKVTNVYPYKYPNGKVVLRVKASENDTDEATLKLLKNNTEDILYYESHTPVVKEAEYDEEGNEISPIEFGEEEFVLKATYEGYTSGDYVSSYANDYYEVEVTKVGATEQKIKSLEDELATTKDALEQANANIEFLALMSDVELI